MSEPNGTVTPRPLRQRSQNPSRGRDGNLPTTPGRSRTPRQAATSEGQGSGYNSPSGRPPKSRNGNKAQQSSQQASTAIPSYDGASSPGLGSKPIPIRSKDENQDQYTTPAKQAYAGPTFHASPAPSSLPLPKFFSRSLPNHDSPSEAPRQAQPGPAETSRPLASGPVNQSPSKTSIHRESSPLDLLFNAHRAEQALQKSSGTPGAGDAKFHSSTLQSPSQGSRAGTSNNMPQSLGKEMFMMEVDGADARSSRDLSSNTTFEERIRALQAQGQPSARTKSGTMDDEQRLAKSLALKQLLKGQAEQSGSDASPRNPGHDGHDSRARSGMDERSLKDPQISPAPVPDAPRSLGPPVGADIKAMEASLRRMLNLHP